MEIPLKPSSESIYDYGFDSGLNRAIPDRSTGVVYDTIENATNAGSMLSGGNLTLKTLSIGAFTRQVAPGDDIQAAIDAVNREGGGTVQLLAKTYNPTSDINLRSNVALVGAGRDVTVLDFAGSSFGLQAKGDSASILQNWGIRDLTVKLSYSAAGVDIDFADFWRLDNVRTTLGSQGGFRVQRSRNYVVDNCRADTNTGTGFNFTSTSSSNRDQLKFAVLNSLADSNGGVGFQVTFSSAINDATAQFNFIGCVADTNTGDGFNFGDGSTTFYLEGNVISCISKNNTGDGFDSTVSGLSFFGCDGSSNTTDGFKLAGTQEGVCVVGSRAFDNGVYDFNFVGAAAATLFGNVFRPGATSYASSFFNESDATLNSLGHTGGSTRTNKKVLKMKNSSGGSIPVGSTLSLAAVAGGEDVTTTTTNGDNKVFGMSMNAISNGGFSRVLTEGYTPSLLVNSSASSISIGDWLSTYSHAYYAKKAVAGDMVFAMALEAPTTSTAQIDALLVTPRLI